MPTYDYMCSTCGATFEFVQSMKDDALTMCPESVCEQAVKGSGEVTRKITGGTGVIYKGQGFYLTDYANKGSDNVAATSEKSAAEKSSAEKSTSDKSSGKDSSSDSSSSSDASSSKPSTTSTTSATATTSTTPTTSTPTAKP